MTLILITPRPGPTFATLLDAARGCEWHKLSPIEVHSDHAVAVLAAVEARLSREDTSEWNEDVLERWRHVCDPASGS